MSNARPLHRHRIPVDIVGIPAGELAERLAHVLDEDFDGTAAQSLLGIATALAGADAPHSGAAHPDGDDAGHEDMLPQLRVVDAVLGKAGAARSPGTAPPFADFDTAERRRRRRRQDISRRDRPESALPPPTPQAENDRLLLEEIGTPAPRIAGGWTAEPTPPDAEPPPTPETLAPLPHPLTDEVMDGFVALRAETPTRPTAAKPKRTLRVKSKPAPVPEAPAEPPPAETAQPAVKLKVKGKPRRIPAAELPPPAEAVVEPPQETLEPEPPPPAVKLKVKGKPRRVPAAEPPPPAEAVAMEGPGEDVAPTEPAAEAIGAEAIAAETMEAGEAADPLLARVEEIIARHRRGHAADTAGSPVLPENREALAALLDEQGPGSDFAALDLLYACWHKNTHHCDHRALLAVAQQLSRNFGLPDKLPMASSKAWKMLDSTVFAHAFADRLAEVGQFIADWQKTQRIFLILEFGEIELIEHLFEALSPADHPDLLAGVMNFKVLSNRRMGLLRRIPARLRKQIQPLLPERKEEALVVLAHGKALLQRIADPHGFAPIVEVATKMLEEVEKLMKQTANAGVPQPPGAPGGGLPLGRIG